MMDLKPIRRGGVVRGEVWNPSPGAQLGLQGGLVGSDRETCLRGGKRAGMCGPGSQGKKVPPGDRTEPTELRECPKEQRGRVCKRRGGEARAREGRVAKQSRQMGRWSRGWGGESCLSCSSPRTSLHPHRGVERKGAILMRSRAFTAHIPGAFTKFRRNPGGPQATNGHPQTDVTTFLPVTPSG